MPLTIRIQDGPDLLDIGFADVEKYHGQGSVAGAALAFMVMHAAFSSQYPDRVPCREELSIVTGHPGPGVRDAFEFITRAVSRNAYRVDEARLQARWNPYSTVSFTFTINDVHGRLVDVSLKQEILPMRFFELLDLKHRGVETENQRQELRQLKRTLADQLLKTRSSDLFQISGQSTSPCR